ncbi:hypothetical protein E2562_013595 [Oryza meyeriana var. granulata]|uniref:Uncharacterized protein n=1 Tax=Oryza meyeriana var. granulata TaxID=110450 RepID=A0A6G1C5H5_9ORYZ|nr:hypothetical protein E2562_013595 [Oryza meyeriana var. granulata]
MDRLAEDLKSQIIWGIDDAPEGAASATGAASHATAEPASTDPAAYGPVEIKTNKHECTSTSKVLGRMASQAWVANKAATTMRKKPNYGAKELQNMLEDRYKVQIPYATGRKPLTIGPGSWNN